MKIADVRTIPLRGATHDTGWPGGTDPNEQMNTLVEIRTDEGLTGLGSCFTSLPFVEASLTLLKPMVPTSKLERLAIDYGSIECIGGLHLKSLPRCSGLITLRCLSDYS